MNSVISKSSAENGSSRNSTSGFGRQRAHDRRRLLLAARQLVRIALQVELDVERRDQLGHAPVDLGLRPAFELQRIGDVVDRAHPREHRLAVVLEHVADLGLARATCRRTGSRPASIGIRPGDHVDQRRLAAAVGAEHRDDLVLRDVEVEVLVQRPAGEVLGEAADGDVRCRPGPARTARPGRRRSTGGVRRIAWLIFRSSARCAARRTGTAR